MIGPTPRRTSIGLAAVLAAVAGIAIASLVAIDRFAESYPDQFRYVGVWIEDALGLGDTADHFVVALELDGPEALVRRLLRHDGAIEAEVYGHTLLTLAFDSPPERAVSPETLAVLVEAGADPNRRDPNGRLPIVEAGRYADPAHLASLLDHGADPHGTDAWNNHALDRACTSRCVDLAAFVRLLLDHGLDPCTIVHRRWTDPPAEWPLATWLVDRGLADLSTRAAAACASTTRPEGPP